MAVPVTLPGTCWRRWLALLDERALLTCMAYVDLNPVRAKMATTPETSDHTSIQRRISSVTHGNEASQPLQLMPFIDHVAAKKFDPKQMASLPIQFAMYLELVDQTGRIMREGKAGAIDKLPQCGRIGGIPGGIGHWPQCPDMD